MAVQTRRPVTYGYVRAATSEQGGGLGVEAQRQRITDAGLEVDVWVEDLGVSGAVAPERRPGSSQLLESIQPGDALVVASLDRLGRDMRDALALAKLAQDGQWRLVILDLGLETGTPMDGFSPTVLTAAAQLERDLVLERTPDASARCGGCEAPGGADGPI